MSIRAGEATGDWGGMLTLQRVSHTAQIYYEKECQRAAPSEGSGGLSAKWFGEGVAMQLRELITMSGSTLRDRPLCQDYSL
jgi:hypothetical protein